MNEQFEYFAVEVSASNLGKGKATATFNALGAQGWELVSVSVLATGGQGRVTDHVAVFKRKKATA